MYKTSPYRILYEFILVQDNLAKKIYIKKSSQARKAHVHSLVRTHRCYKTLTEMARLFCIEQNGQMVVEKRER